ncbi:MAG: DegT/DnrJ/EryC1/StrS family aminotransferase [Nanoarchaeota archaeon]
MRKISFKDALGLASNLLKGRNFLDKKVHSYFRNQFKGDFILLDSGTSSMQALIEDFKLKGSEVIIPSFICSDVFTSLFIQNEINPIIIDCKKDSLNISLSDVKKKITKKTKAILIVHTLGIPSNPEGFRKLCDKNKIILIEDCAHAISTPYKNSYLGNFGDASIFSFAKEMPNFAGGIYLNNRRKINSSLTLKIPAYRYSLRTLKMLFHKTVFSRFYLSIKKRRDKGEQHSDKPRIPQTMPKLAKAMAIHYLQKRDIKTKRENALKLYEELKRHKIDAPLTKEDIASFSAKSFPLLTNHQEKVLQELFDLGLNPGKGWTPVFSQNKVVQKWGLPPTPVAEHYSRSLVTVSLDEVTEDNLSLIASIIQKEKIT